MVISPIYKCNQPLPPSHSEGDCFLRISFALIVSWALTNDIGDLNALLTGNKDFIYIQHQVGTQYLINERFSGTTFFDFAILNEGQTYYVEIIRNENIGSFGQLSVLIYSDNGRTVLVDTISILLHAKLDFRYIFGIMSFNDSNAGSTDITVSNLDLQEIAVFQAAWTRNSNQIIGAAQ